MTMPPRLIVTLPLGPGRLVFDLVPDKGGVLTVTLTRWIGDVQQGREVTFPVSSASGMARLPMAVQAAIAAHERGASRPQVPSLQAAE